MTDKLQKIIIAALEPYLPEIINGIYPEGNASANAAKYPFATLAVSVEETVPGNLTVKANVEFSVISDPIGDLECANLYAAALCDAVFKSGCSRAATLASAAEKIENPPHFYTGLWFERLDSPTPETFGNDDVFRTGIVYRLHCQF